MKSRYVLAGTLVLLTMMLTLIGSAAAQIEFYPAIQVPPKLKGTVWYFKTYDDSSGAFDGRDVIRSSVVAYCYDNDGNYYYLKPVLILKTQNYVFLFFCPKDLPTVDIAGTTVEGKLTNGDTFYASGPGFTWSNFH
jgi:hypothetical protein